MINGSEVMIEASGRVDVNAIYGSHTAVTAKDSVSIGLCTGQIKVRIVDW